MNFKEYQGRAAQTARYPKEIALPYLVMGLAGEAGEVANKVKKVYRDNGGIVTEDKRTAIADEISDCLWYLAMLCRELDLSLDDVAQANLAKLADRAKRGVLSGNGDAR